MLCACEGEEAILSLDWDENWSVPHTVLNCPCSKTSTLDACTPEHVSMFVIRSLETGVHSSTDRGVESFLDFTFFFFKRKETSQQHKAVSCAVWPTVDGTEHYCSMTHCWWHWTLLLINTKEPRHQCSLCSLHMNLWYWCGLTCEPRLKQMNISNTLDFGLDEDLLGWTHGSRKSWSEHIFIDLLYTSHHLCLCPEPVCGLRQNVHIFIFFHAPLIQIKKLPGNAS